MTCGDYAGIEIIFQEAPKKEPQSLANHQFWISLTLENLSLLKVLWMWNLRILFIPRDRLDTWN